MKLALICLIDTEYQWDSMLRGQSLVYDNDYQKIYILYKDPIYLKRCIEYNNVKTMNKVKVDAKSTNDSHLLLRVFCFSAF